MAVTPRSRATSYKPAMFTSAVIISFLINTSIFVDFRKNEPILTDFTDTAFPITDQRPYVIDDYPTSISPPNLFGKYFYV